MKRMFLFLFSTLAAAALVCGCAIGTDPALTTANMPSPALTDQISKAPVFTGTISAFERGKLLKGPAGWYWNDWIEVASASGERKDFYIRANSVIIANGIHYPFTQMHHWMKEGLKVKVRYAAITDASGGGSGDGFGYEVGKNGVLQMRLFH